jgi:hypothetical protein
VSFDSPDTVKIAPDALEQLEAKPGDELFCLPLP